MWFTIGLFILACIVYFLDEGGIYAKAVLASIVISISSTLLMYITGIDFFAVLIEMCGIVAVLAITIPLLMAIFRKS